MIDSKRLDEIEAKLNLVPDKSFVPASSVSELLEIIRLARLGLWAEQTGIPALFTAQREERERIYEDAWCPSFAGCGGVTIQTQYDEALAALPKSGEGVE